MWSPLWPTRCLVLLAAFLVECSRGEDAAAAGTAATAPAGGSSAVPDSPEPPPLQEDGGPPLWHLVDVPALVCPGGRGKDEVTFTLEDVGEAMRGKSHILSVYRTSNHHVVLRLKVTDSADPPRTIISQIRIPLAHLNSTKTQATVARLLAAHGGGHASHSHSHHGRSESEAAGGSATDTADGVNVRGGAGLDDAGAAGSGAARAPVIHTGIVEGLSQRFPGGFRKTMYGYTGARATLQTSAIAVPLWLAHQALLTSPASDGYVYSRWDTFGLDNFAEQCASGNWTGACQECTEQGREDCMAVFEPPEDMVRDDLLVTGFSPQGITWPLRVTITKVAGTDYSAEKLCPPAGWRPRTLSAAASQPTSAQSVAWKPPEWGDIFISLTPIESPRNQTNTDRRLNLVISILVGAALVAAAAFFCTRPTAQKSQLEMASNFEDEYAGHPQAAPE